ncbi:3-phosphoshikimate 1-carboxyvinyltransferase [Frondihabitans sp. PAMC 28766]|uniref:3-phosphoshikimate 1-carboxyvinyltransferase n=1 Tax=Frondihabitans sp. PAMC 28766 TaxID=1795630 RepID=UPI00078E6222|nr:3-phosphoshikimate 1-carboxyvinyltransferase [Frondihabitans sp. PAMC 28766]AMM21266.1 3-phosphoshikimate 1-carboxyvinyltransferase [Frondihabitans sp. PAMC 28766]
MQLVVRGTSTRLEGELEIPVSKYHAHRALVLASLAPGRSVITGVSTTRQVEWTVGTLRALGTKITVDGDRYIVEGGPYQATDIVDHGSKGAEGLLNMGSSGTTLYFMVGLASLADQPMTLTGMKYFRRRPIKALLDSLQQMGVELEADQDRPPVHVQPKRPRGGEVSIAGTLSQWLSGLLLLAPFAETDTVVHVTGGTLNEQPYVDLTIRMMRLWGLTVEHSDDWLTFTIPSNQTATPADYTIPADIGSAAFGIAAAAIHPSDVLFTGLRTFKTSETDHPESEFLDLASEMGVRFSIDEETGYVRIVSDGAPLRAIDIDCQPIPDLLPILATMATFARGTSIFRNVGHIRLKESDRVSAMLQLNNLGGTAAQTHDELRVTGATQPLVGAPLSSFNDHRVLMSLAIAGTRAAGATTLTYPRAYRISYPTFLEAMTSIGLDLDMGDPKTLETPENVEFERDELSEASQQEAPLELRGVDADPLVLSEKVRQMAETRPNDAAVIEVGGVEPVTTTWRELQDEADKVSQLLIELGVQRGESVAMQLPNWKEFVAITLGTVQIGAVATPIMPVFGPRETTMTLSRSRARVVFLPNLFRRRRPAIELLDVIDEAKAQKRRLSLEHVVVLRSESRGDSSAHADATPIPAAVASRVEASEWNWRYYDIALGAVTPDLALIRELAPTPEDICQLLFTSGTTGEPKGVQHPHRTLGLATAMEVAHLGLGDADRVYIPSPLAHQTGFLYGMLLSWRLGVASVIQPVWDAKVALTQAFHASKASFVQCATPFLTDLVAEVEGGIPQPESLRIFVATGAAVPRALAQKATTVLETSVLGAFGTSETCLGALSTPFDAPEDAWGSDGKPLPGIRLRIVDDEGVELPAGIEGNYELHSPTMFGGYLDRPDLTDDVFTADGWYRTGDLAIVDDKGFLHITGRIKDVINRGGEKIPVVEIENLLYQHPLVSDAAIVAMPDPRLGERACAFVVASKTGVHLEFADMKKYLGDAGVSKYYWPERLEFIDEIPRNAVGKVQKNVLRDQAAALVARDTVKENQK